MGSIGTGGTSSTAQGMDVGGPMRTVIELYCGSCALVRYIHSQLESNTHQDGVPDVWYMCIDCLSQKEIEQKYAK